MSDLTVEDPPAEYDEGDELASIASAGLGDDDEQSETLDVEVPTKIKFGGISIDDIDGAGLRLGDVVTVVVRGRVERIGDVQMKDHVRHEVGVLVESVVQQTD